MDQSHSQHNQEIREVWSAFERGAPFVCPCYGEFLPMRWHGLYTDPG